MLDLGWTEILMIGVIAVVVIGPKDLPKAMHGLAQWMRKLRGMARDFQGQVDDMVKGTELEEVKKAAQGLNRYNVKRQISNVVDPKGQMKKALEETRRAANERLDVRDTSSTGMATPTEAGDAIAEASIGGGVGGAKRPAIEEAEPTPAEDEAAIAATRGNRAPEPEVPAEPEAPSEPAPKRKPARKTSTSAAATKSSRTREAGTAKKPRRKAKKPAGTGASSGSGSTAAKAEASEPAAKRSNGATPPAPDTETQMQGPPTGGGGGASKKGTASKPAGRARRTTAKRGPERKPGGGTAGSGAAATQGE